MPRFSVKERKVYDIVDSEATPSEHEEYVAINVFRDKKEAEAEVDRLHKMIEENATEGDKK